MIANIKILEKYCTDYKNIENYDEAIKSPLRYDLHHRLEISENKSRKDLIDENLYYDRPATELIFLSHVEHSRLHKEGVNHKGENNPMFGKNPSAETRQKISEAMKGNQNTLGHHFSAETKQKMSEAGKGKLKGLHWHLEDGHRIWTD